ncbi:tRNA(Ile)-lysidine synthase [Sulfurisoma sediminicola]|uniref:tRNA(Ile)-lysidine synthase n=1 Tax=Sulfurisoma sediminicola TaxID=1381557 RepID=A0A497X9Y5_9PROT|nr:tRNA(Ile)-lysidine synthase [Sulfurisoma sediminicola]
MLATCAAALAAQIAPGQHLTLALSGGVDSVTLLHLLASLAPMAQFELAAIHVNHGLSENAEQWAAFCAILCQAKGIPLTIERVVVDRESPDGLEAAARRARHAAFAHASGDFIVLGHHRGDQAETLLFNLVRGTGLAGSAAMAPRQRRLLRPLLTVSRAEIEAYAREQGLDWVDDESNRDTGFSRNFLRHEILEPLHRRFPAAERNLAAATGRFSEAVTLLDDLARIDLADQLDFPLAVATLASLSEPRARNALRYLLARRGIGIPSESRLVEALRQLLAAGHDRHPRQHFGEWDIVRRRGKIDLEHVR